MQSCGAIRKDILERAKACVCGERDEQYGAPENSFHAIADLWSTYLKWKWYGACKIPNLTPTDVAVMMVLFKAARVATGQNKRDNWVDMAGYAACGGEVSEVRTAFDDDWSDATEYDPEPPREVT